MTDYDIEDSPWDSHIPKTEADVEALSDEELQDLFRVADQASAEWHLVMKLCRDVAGDRGILL